MKGIEIAKLSGVSKSTLSRVMNNSPKVSEETRKKVLEIISQYGYLPDASARSLAGKPHNTVGLFIVSIPERSQEYQVYQNSYYSPYLELITDELNAKGYYVLVNVISSREDHERIRNAFLQKRVYGGIVLGTETVIGDFGDILKNGYPLVIVDFDPEEAGVFGAGRDNLTIVNSMNYEGGRAAVEYLISLGHREIGLIAGRETSYNGRERNRAYRDVMAQHGLPLRSEFFLQGHLWADIAAREVSGMVDRGTLPTAIFSASDEMALAAISVFKKRGIRVPEDISVVGFDDVAIASAVTPALTTVRMPYCDMARCAVESILSALNGGGSQGVKRLPVELIERDSCMRHTV
jgi:LacI family transcriptional regulator